MFHWFFTSLLRAYYYGYQQKENSDKVQHCIIGNLSILCHLIHQQTQNVYFPTDERLCINKVHTSCTGNNRV